MKIGIVGLGSIGQRHAENARKLGHQVVVYDPVAASGYRFERQLYDDPDVNAVVVATPSAAHEGPLRAAVERGKHVLIEKPISVGEGALQQLLDAARAKQLVVMMGNNLRFHPGIKRAKDWVDSGVAGAPTWANFICATEFTQTAARDGVILNTGAHEVDIALHLFGPAVVLSAVSSHDISADFVLQHDCGVRSTFHLDIDTPSRLRQFWISCEQENVCIDLDRRTFWRPKHGTYLGGNYATDYVTEMQAFTDRIAGKETLGATGEEGLDCLRVLLDIRKKAGL